MAISSTRSVPPHRRGHPQRGATQRAAPCSPAEPLPGHHQGVCRTQASSCDLAPGSHDHCRISLPSLRSNPPRTQLEHQVLLCCSVFQNLCVCEPKLVESERAFTEVLDSIACCLTQGDGELVHATEMWRHRSRMILKKETACVLLSVLESRCHFDWPVSCGVFSSCGRAESGHESESCVSCPDDSQTERCVCCIV